MDVQQATVVAEPRPAGASPTVRTAIHVDNLNAGTIRVRTDSERVEEHPPAANVHRPLIDDFVAAVREHREPAVTGDTGRAVAAIEDVIYAVAPSGG